MNLKILQAILEFLDSDGFKNTSYRLLKKQNKKRSGDHNQLLGDKVMRLCDVAIWLSVTS